MSQQTADDTGKLFLKPVVVADDHTVTFQHAVRPVGGKPGKAKTYHLTSPAFKDLTGKTVLIDTGMSVFRNHQKIGVATLVKS